MSPPTVDDRTCFEGILVRLVTGCSWVDAERLIGNRVSGTTLRARRDEWIEAGVFDDLADEALAAYDQIIGFDLGDCSVDASLHKAPRAQDETGIYVALAQHLGAELLTGDHKLASAPNLPVKPLHLPAP